MKKNGYTFSGGLDATGRIAMKYGIQGVPTSILISPEGKVLKISDIIPKDSNDKKIVSEEAEEEMTVIPVGMKEIKPEDLQSERHKMIDNPLPVPKKKLHKEMDYALKSTEEDDYDLKDLSDKDFFDIN